LRPFPGHRFASCVRKPKSAASWRHEYPQIPL
jgi:hypothetical protein